MSDKTLGSDVPKMDIKKTVVQAVRNTVDRSIMKPVTARLRKRMTELREESSAFTEKVQIGHMKKFYTTPPKRFLAGIEGTISGGRGIITYSEYEVGDDGNKVLVEHKADKVLETGQVIQVTASSNYKLKGQTVETIEYQKAIKIEKFDDAEGY